MRKVKRSKPIFLYLLLTPRLVAAGICSQPARVSDRNGRTLLHAAASSGRKRVVEWLVGVKEAALNSKDAESGYTALHRAIYSGQESTRKYDVFYALFLTIAIHDVHKLQTIVSSWLIFYRSMWPSTFLAGVPILLWSTTRA